jgi:ATP-dependent protease ClpP protease subunit
VRTIINDEEITLCDLEEFQAEQERIEGEKRENLSEWVRNMRAAQAWFIDYISSRTGVSRSTLLSLMQNEATLSAREGVRYGIAHRIVEAEENHCITCDNVL